MTSHSKTNGLYLKSTGELSEAAKAKIDAYRERKREKIDRMIRDYNQAQ